MTRKLRKLKALNQDSIYMTAVYLFSLASKDERTKIGAIIVGPEGELISTGYNGFPRGVNDDQDSRQERPEKYFWMEHAERNAIYNAARIGVSTKGCTMYTQGIPCDLGCSRAVIQAGITKVVIHKLWNDGNVEKYVRSYVMFEESGVEVVEWDGAILTPIGWNDNTPVYMCQNPLNLMLPENIHDW